MTYAKYALAAVMAAVTVSAQDAVETKNTGSSCCNSWGCAHSSSYRSCGTPSSSCDTCCCPSDKIAFDKLYASDGANPIEFLPFYMPEDENAIKGVAYTDMKPAGEGDEQKAFTFASGTGAFKVTNENGVNSAQAPEVADGETKVEVKNLPKDAVIVGFETKSGSYLLPEQKDDALKVAKGVTGFWVLKSSMQEAASTKSHGEENKDDTPPPTPAEGGE